MVLNDTELIIKAQNGSDSAFEELIYHYDKNVLSMAMRYADNEDDAKDLYQEVFIRVYKGLKKFKFKSEFSTWLYRIAVNVCLTYRSRSKEHLKVRLKNYDVSENDSISTQQFEYDGVSPEEQVSSSDIGNMVNAAVAELTPKQKLTFTLKHYEGYKIREIAQMLECKEGTVKKYLFDAVKNLRKKLKPVYVNIE